MNKIYLASKSPRRRELLRQIGVEFELLLLRDHPMRGVDVSEEVEANESAAHYVTRIAREKADFAQYTMQMRRLPVRPILAADTTVTLNQRIFGKPASMTEAVEMIQALSGQTHQVLTSVAVRMGEQQLQITHSSEVTFCTVSKERIQAYCSTQEPYDKAGAYAIQGFASMFIEKIVGSHSGIMGLPLFEAAQLLEKTGVQIL